MNERDMRVIKTKESIEKALFELLAVKPLDKVTVVELARAARIQAGRVHPGKLLNVKFEGFDKIEDAFKLMDAKPKDLIKPYVVI